MDRKQGLRTLFTLQRARIGHGSRPAPRRSKVQVIENRMLGPAELSSDAIGWVAAGVHDRGRDRSDDLVEETSAAEVSRRPAGIRIVTAAPMIAGRAKANS